MRQINFVIIFIFCLAFALFSIQNTEPGVINIVPGTQVQAPIALELLIAIGVGAALAWVFSLWTHLQQLLINNMQMRRKNVQIKELESQLKNYQTEIQSLKLALPPAEDSLKPESQTANQ